jgi:hypothetical protein
MCVSDEEKPFSNVGRTRRSFAVDVDVTDATEDPGDNEIKLFSSTLMLNQNMLHWRHDTQPNDIQHNDIITLTIMALGIATLSIMMLRF